MIFFRLRNKFTAIGSEKKNHNHNFNFEEPNSRLNIYNSERKNVHTYLDFRNDSPSPNPNPDVKAKEILTSWMRNEKEAYEIKSKYNSSNEISKKQNFFNNKM